MAQAAFNLLIGFAKQDQYVTAGGIRIRRHCGSSQQLIGFLYGIEGCRDNAFGG
jgi:hypothetical protein